MQIPEPYRNAYKAAKRQGWTITQAGSDDLCWQPPRGRKPVIMPFTPGTRAEIRHELARLRKAGLKSISRVHGSVRAVFRRTARSGQEPLMMARIGGRMEAVADYVSAHPGC